MIETRTPVAVSVVADPMADLRQLSGRAVAVVPGVDGPGLSGTH
jgi:hypothetical protein